MAQAKKQIIHDSARPVFRIVNGVFTRGSMPDFKDPRRIKGAIKALELCYELDLTPSGRRRMTATAIRKILGNKSSNSFAAFKHTLLDQRGYYSTAGECYEYQTVPHRVERLEGMLGLETAFLDYAEKKGKSFKTAPSLAEYKRTGDRHYHWWTSMRRDPRQKLFLQTHSRMFDYDLEAAKPSLTLQGWNRWMLEHHAVQFQTNADCRLPTWTRLIENRTAFRAQMALECGITKEEAKQVCQNVLNSTWASPNQHNGICRLVGKEATFRIMQCALYRGLQKEFRVMWSFFKKSQNVQGKTAGQFMSAYYNALEAQVMAVIAKHVESDAWFIHDGFMTHTQIDMQALIERVKFETGFDVKIECQEVCRSE